MAHEYGTISKSQVDPALKTDTSIKVKWFRK